MDVEVRALEEGEFAEYLRVMYAAFGDGPPDDEESAAERKVTEMDRTRVAFEGGRIVATSTALSFELTVPGLATVPASGVTGVAVLPTHRRRGLLRRMMGALLDDAVERGEPVAILLASESIIYGRFGYGLAASHQSVEIDARHGAFLQPQAPTGRIELVDGATAVKVLAPVLDRARLAQPGDINRTTTKWELLVLDPEKRREGASPWFYAVHESAAGEADGYALYRVKDAWEHGSPKGRVLAREVVGLTPAAEAELWQFLFSLDLVEVVGCEHRPLDDPLRWMLADPRRLRSTMVGDFLWVRVLDVPAALAARRYRVPGTLVLEVIDAFRPEAGGRFRLVGGPDGAECAPTGADPDLVLSAADLGALYLGGVAPSTLAAAGRVQERRPGAVAEADVMLGCQPLPFCRTGF